MAVITISRQYGSGGDEIAAQVCERLGYHYFDKNLMAQVANDVGLSVQEVVDFPEDDHKVRGFLDRLFTGGPREAGTRARVWTESTTGVRAAESVDVDAAMRITVMQGIIKGACRRGNFVIVGRGGQAVLKDTPGVLHVRVTAPLEQRIQRLREQQPLGREEAKALVTKMDAAAVDYLRRFYQLDVSDPELYHLAINTGKWDVAAAAQLVAQAVSYLPAAAPV